MNIWKKEGKKENYVFSVNGYCDFKIELESAKIDKNIVNNTWHLSGSLYESVKIEKKLLNCNSAAEAQCLAENIIKELITKEMVLHTKKLNEISSKLYCITKESDPLARPKWIARNTNVYGYTIGKDEDVFILSYKVKSGESEDTGKKWLLSGSIDDICYTEYEVEPDAFKNAEQMIQRTLTKKMIYHLKICNQYSLALQYFIPSL